MEICISGLLLGIGAFSDFKNRKIPLGLILPATIAALVLAGMRGEGTYPFLIRLLPGAFLWMLRILTRKGIGMGDVLAVFVLSLLFGTTEALWILTGASLLSLLGFMILRVLKKKPEDRQMPLYPYLFVSWGCYILLEYLHLFGEIGGKWTWEV